MSESGVRPPSLMGLPSYLAGNVARVGHRRLADALSAGDLRLSHYAVLSALADFGSLAQHQLSDRLDVDRSHLVGYVDHLEKHGLVTRQRDPLDRRRQLVALSDAGRKTLRDLRTVARRSQQDVLKVLSSAEQQTLMSLLARVLNAADQARLGNDET